MFGLRISAIARLLSVLVVCGFLTSVGTAIYGLNTLKVGGPVYEQVVDMKDLVADILPPPAYVIEAYLEATLTMQHPEQVKEHRQKLATLHSDYTDRKKYWEGKSIDPKIKTLLTVESDKHVAAFWTLVEKDFLPAVERGDMAASAAAYERITAAYTAHRAVINATVDASNDAAKASETFAAAKNSSLTLAIWAVSAIVLLLVAAAALAIDRGLVAPVTRITSVMYSLSKGDLAVSVPYTGRQDEIGDMAAALNIFRDNSREIERLNLQQAQERAEADKERRAVLNKMAADLEAKVLEVVHTVASAATELEATAQEVTAATMKSSDQANTVTNAATTATANVQAVSAATEELSASIAEISRQAASASDVAAAAVEQTGTAVANVQSLAVVAGRIDNVVKLIGDVAEQTNLLALNATIEAARAGEAGKGFAVVASEVKALASQTAKATADISVELKTVRDGTARVVDAIQAVSEVIRNLREISGAIQHSVNQQQQAAKEISHNVHEAAYRTEEVSHSITAVSESAASAGAASQQVLGAAAQLSRNSEQLRADVGNFLRDVRTAA